MSAYIVDESVIKNIVVNFSLLQYEKKAIKINLSAVSLIANELMAENVRSVNYRYSDNTEAEKINITFGDLETFKTDKKTALDDVRQLQYQSCQCESYEETEAYKTLLNIENFIKFGCDPEIYQNNCTSLHLGQKVHLKLYGGKTGYISWIEGEQKPSSCGVVGGVMHVGGMAHFDIIWENLTESKKTPESIVNGVQWIIYPDVISTQALCNLQAETYLKMQSDKVKKEAAAIKYAETVEAMPEKHPHFIKTGDIAGPKLAAKNIRIALKRAFKGVKFSVRMRDYNCINIGWTDGPIDKDVSEIVQQFKAGNFDGMTDSYNYVSDAFTDAFGYCDYIFTYRTESDSLIKKAIALMYEKLKANFIRDGLNCPTVEQYCKGELMSWQLSGLHEWGGEDVQNEIRKEMAGLAL